MLSSLSIQHCGNLALGSCPMLGRITLEAIALGDEICRRLHHTIALFGSRGRFYSRFSWSGRLSGSGLGFCPGRFCCWSFLFCDRSCRFLRDRRLGFFRFRCSRSLSCRLLFHCCLYSRFRGLRLASSRATCFCGCRFFCNWFCLLFSHVNHLAVQVKIQG